MRKAKQKMAMHLQAARIKIFLNTVEINKFPIVYVSVSSLNDSSGRLSQR